MLHHRRHNWLYYIIINQLHYSTQLQYLVLKETQHQINSTPIKLNTNYAQHKFN
jgi:hypothetical protein